MVGGRLLVEMDTMQLFVSPTLVPHFFGLFSDPLESRTDGLESQLAAELENGRLVRLLCKFGFINERPECATPSCF